MDVFKALGITVGEKSLIEQVDNKEIAKGDESKQIVRKGMDVSARERLEGQLEKGFVLSRAPQYAPGHEKSTDYAGTLKNTHGENWHNDNDRMVEDFLSSAEEVDREFGAEANPNTKTPRHPGTYAPTGEQGFALEFKSLSQEELLLKAFGDLEKAAPKGVDPAKHERCVKKVKAQGHDVGSAHAICTSSLKGAKKSELDEIFDLIKGEKKKYDFNKDGKMDAHEKHHAEMDEEIEEAEEETEKAMPLPPAKASGKRLPRATKDPVQAKQERAQKKELLGKWAKKSDEDNLAPIAPDPYRNKKDLIANVHENSSGVTEQLRPAPFQKGLSKFIKAAGPGGMIFDFGGATGNPLADRATALLNQTADPVQSQSANYQSTSYQKALTDYVTKGDAAYSQQASMFGNIDKGWEKQLNEPIDKQVKEAFEKGELTADPTAPAVKNEFNKTELNLGGQVIKATSETDAFVLELMRGHMEAQSGGGLVADATTGGKISITAGDPLPQV